MRRTRLADRARSGAGPALLECVAVRLDPHHLHDDQSRYRDAESLKAAWAQEPIARAGKRLRESGLTEEALQREGAAATGARGRSRQIGDRRSRRPSLEAVFAHTYYEGREVSQ